MGEAYIFSLQPTFTQGLILGQFSILFLLVLILKYLFFDTVSDRSYRTSSYQPKVERDEDEEGIALIAERLGAMPGLEEKDGGSGMESADWLNGLLRQVLEAYRIKLRGSLPGAAGDEVARKRVEEYANKLRPPDFLDPIKVHSVDLGVSAPRLSRARLKQTTSPEADPEIEFDMSYVDTLSVSISTSVLFNYPFPSFARLPVSLTISLSLFSSSIVLTPPYPQAQHPTITLTLPSPDTEFTLNIQTKSLMGSRAKLADVPKLHELITHQIRKVLTEKGTWKVVLPGLATVNEIKEDIIKERELAEHLGN
ncbi:maintenance of mitochondrial morphology protein 1 [Laetiporus sulphureus 93-53]|uniref:Maintenance of mitochondrial morphology protein 1 n=1 Tax=Laetiporus sulphureus 93-53 TaxID=1314785 RepID=A0A165EED9_9APHY|nr:maintenance of mitochondrial morphology protein 1 [Laetiporus sulphureus 93-53]KZT06868.1 maintenance of mitochondrial morphology protein 1 [Laetiporus sulphureus 93-53]